MASATGPDQLVLEQAPQIGWKDLLLRPGLDVSEMTVASFVENAFVPEHVAAKGLSGRTHYQAILKHVLPPEEVDRVFRGAAVRPGSRLRELRDWPYLGSVRLHEAGSDDVRRLVSAAMASGYSTQTVTHIRNVVSAIFEHARKKGWFSGENPARGVALPEMSRKEAHALTLSEAKQVLDIMRYPEKEMALIAILTSLNVAEICGLQWKHVNLTDAWSSAGGTPIPPRTIAVRKQWYLGELTSVKGRRLRDQPIPVPLLPTLLRLSQRGKCTGPDNFVLVSRVGTPIKANNIVARRLKPIGRELGIPHLSWHVFLRTRSTLAHEMGMVGLGESVA